MKEAKKEEMIGKPVVLWGGKLGTVVDTIGHATYVVQVPNVEKQVDEGR